MKIAKHLGFLSVLLFALLLAGSAGAISISTCEELQAMQNDLFADYVLTDNLDCSATNPTVGGSIWGNEGFDPIGDNANLFEGTFDGQGFEITGLFINRPTTDFVGLFGVVANSKIENVGLINMDITSDESSGGLVGRNAINGTIYNSYSTGIITGDGGIGGLVGSNWGNITNCYSDADVTGDERVAGLVGSHYDGLITNSYATGNVVGTMPQVGGLVGNMGGDITISYATGNVTGADCVGGLAGSVYTANISNTYTRGNVIGNDGVGGLAGCVESSVLITNSYATGQVSGSANVGGFVGNKTGGSCNDCFWDIETSLQPTSNCGTGETGKLTPEMKNVATFTDISTVGLNNAWDFVGNPNNDLANEDIWDIDGVTNDGYPFFPFPGAVSECNPDEVCCLATGFFEPVTTPCNNWVVGEQCSGSDCGDNVEEHSFTQYCSGNAETCTGSTVDNGFVVKDDCGVNEKCDDTGPSPLCVVDPVCTFLLPPAEFQIISFVLSENFISVESDSSAPVNAVVKIINIGADAGDAFVEIVVKDLEGNEMLPVPLTASSPGLAGSAMAEHTFVVDVPGSWEPGLYTFYANVGDGSPPLHDQKIKTLTLSLIRPAPVPELPLFLVPLAAFSVLAFLFFSERKDFSKP